MVGPGGATAHVYVHKGAATAGRAAYCQSSYELRPVATDPMFVWQLRYQPELSSQTYTGAAIDAVGGRHKI